MHGREHIDPGQTPHFRPGDDAASCCGGSSKAAANSSGGGCCGGGACGSGADSGGCGSQEQVLVFTRAQSREIDRLAVEEFAMPSILLMENAARGVSSVILEGLQGAATPTVLLACGPGNNGGDGLAIARHLHNRGVGVGVVLGAEAARYSGDALTNLKICLAMGVPMVQAHAEPARAMEQMIALIGEPHVIVDALLGTGADRPARGPIGELIELVNQQRGKGTSVISIDLPSGMNCDTGEPCSDAEAPGQGLGPCVTADLTIALVGVKSGFMNASAQQYVGELVVVDIGAPTALLRRLGTPMDAFAGEVAGRDQV